MINQEVKLNDKTMQAFINLLKIECSSNPGNDMMQSLAFVSRQMQEIEDNGINEMKRQFMMVRDSLSTSASTVRSCSWSAKCQMAGRVCLPLVPKSLRSSLRPRP